MHSKGGVLQLRTCHDGCVEHLRRGYDPIKPEIQQSKAKRQHTLTLIGNDWEHLPTKAWTRHQSNKRNMAQIEVFL